MTATTTDDEELAEFNDTWEELRQDRPDAPWNDEITLAGQFVARFGALGDWFEGRDLTEAQYTRGVDGAADLVGHWSASRGEPGEEIHPEFAGHTTSCRTCSYLESALEIHAEFEEERCQDCGLDVHSHEVAPDADSQPVTYCLSPWERRDPAFHEAADAGGPDQLSPVAWEASFKAPLTDGTFGVITRYYYVIERDGRRFLEEQVEYIWCRDPDHPGDTEINAEYTYTEIDPEGDTLDEGTDVQFFAEQANYPDLDEWEVHAYVDARGLLALRPTGA